MKCEYCGKEFEQSTRGRKRKYCSQECRRSADRDHQRMVYVGTREQTCKQCGKDLPKYKTRFCSEDCCRRYNHIKNGMISHDEILTKTCIVCGKDFQTWKSNKICCSPECSALNKKEKGNEAARIRYQNTPHRSWDEYVAQRLVQKQERAERLAAESKKRKEELQKRKAEKEAQKAANIAYWQNYNEEHTCNICGNTFISHYPTTKYCSDSCRRAAHKTKHRYDGITIDNDIALKRLARRDHNLCKICGFFVDWNDYVITDKGKICGNMYPSIDHIQPISKEGLHSWDNIQLAHRICNSYKGNKVI